MIKLWFAIALGLLITACTSPSRVAPSVQSNVISGPFFSKVTSRTINIPIPKPYSFKLDGDWSIRQDIFSLENQLMAFTFIKGNEEISFRGGKKTFLYKDSTFVVESTANDEAFVRYYLKWDHDYATSLYEIVQQGEVNGPVYNLADRYGFIKVTNGNYQRCVLAMIEEDVIYMMTAKAIDSQKDVCNTALEIWKSRHLF